MLIIAIGDEWQKDYTATYYALQLEYFKTPVANMFLAFPTMLKVLTYFVLLVKMSFLN